MRELYDLALVYGPGPDDDVRIQALRAAGIPVHRTGMVAAAPVTDGAPDFGDGYLLAVAGGGVDGFDLLECVIAAKRSDAVPGPVVLVAGPIMPSEQVASLRERARGLDVRVESSRYDMDAMLAGARAVVAMAGYCTVAEILASGKPALLVPRSFPREEQLNRARLWSRSGHVEMLEPQELSPVRLGKEIERLLERPGMPARPLTGAEDAVRILTEARAAP